MSPRISEGARAVFLLHNDDGNGGKRRSDRTQAAGDSGGTLTTVAVGEYIYTFKNKAPAGFDPTLTNRIAVYGSRSLTAYDLAAIMRPRPTISCRRAHSGAARHCSGSRL